MSVITPRKKNPSIKSESESNLRNESPLVKMMYEFFTDPNSSRVAYAWAFLTCWIVVLRILEIAIESCDGPNQYTGRKNMAKYKFLLTDQHYWIVYITCMVPLILDAIGRSVLILLVVFRNENYNLYNSFTTDRLEMFLFFCDILGVIPFLTTALYLRPYSVRLDQGESVVYYLLELLIASRILRMIRNMRAIRAIRIALLNSFEHLVLPVFFFFMFNITTGVYFYFVEPCFNTAICPWNDLFESTFFSIVTMTTVGYGNQVPFYETGRFMACCVMIFGSLFLSMPLAIIGNEYDNAWKIVKAEENAKKNIKSVDDENENNNEILKKQKALKEFEKEKLMVSSDPVIAVHKVLRESIASLKASCEYISDISHHNDSMQQQQSFVNPSLLLRYCELSANLPVLLNALRSELAFLVREKQQFSDKNVESLANKGQNQNQERRMSIFNHAAAVSKDDNEDGSDEVDDDDDDKEFMLPTNSKESEVPEDVPEKIIRRTSTDIRKKVAGKLIKGESEVEVNKRISMYAKILKVVNVSDVEEIRRRTSSEEFYDRMDTIAKNPNSLRTRIWVLLEFPNSSKEARILQIILLILICWSVLILFTETVNSLTLYGETSEICQNVVQVYCRDKRNSSMDPGCFVNTGFNITKLQFNCDDSDCYGVAPNFGADKTNLTCNAKGIQPFATKNELYYEFGSPTMFTNRIKMNQVNPVCNRIECTDNSHEYQNGFPLWFISEFVTVIIFSIEWVLRIFVADSLKHYFSDYMNYFDMLSIFPFYVEVFNSVIYKSFSRITFSILSSAPQQILLVYMRSLKIFRMFKLTRHFTASKVLSETAKIIWPQILGMISFLVFLVILFAILLYQVEAGKACYVGDAGCHVPANAVVNIGDRILINKDGSLSQFSNVFYGFWFSIVTLTTTGYGDIVPVTNAGQIMAIILMVTGTFYMAMPLTAAATAFFAVHEVYEKKRKENEIAQNAVKNATILSTMASSSSMSMSMLVSARSTKVSPDSNMLSEIGSSQSIGLSSTNKLLLFGDHLDNKLKKRIQLFLTDIYILHASIDDLLKDLQAKSFRFEDEVKIDRDSGLAMIEINNHKIPVLRKIRNETIADDDITSNNSSSNPSISSGQQGPNPRSTYIKTKKQQHPTSALFAKILQHCNKLEELLNRCEDDIIRIVVLHHKLRKNF